MEQIFFIVTILSLVFAPMLVGCFNASMEEQNFLRKKRSRSLKLLNGVASVAACPFVLLVTILSLILAHILVGCYNAICARRKYWKERHYNKLGVRKKYWEECCVVHTNQVFGRSNPTCMIVKTHVPKNEIRLYVSLFSVGYEIAIIEKNVQRNGIICNKCFSFLGPSYY